MTGIAAAPARMPDDAAMAPSKRSGRISATFARLREQGRRALIPYVTAGFPFADITPELMHGMVAAGADVIELGVPFSDPMADGPVIQQAGEAALALGIGLKQVLAMVARFRENDASTPVVLMGYANPIERFDHVHGPGSFIQSAAAAGVDGILVVDYPPEECEQFAADLRAAGIDLIFLLAPTSSEERMAQVGRIASGYVYYVSLKGVTGAGHLDTEAVGRMVPRIRQHVDLPVGVGFGIRNAQTAQAVGSAADAVVIGTRLIQLIEQQPRDKVVGAASGFLAEIRLALDALPAATAKNAAGR
ncbi:Tryptophan synthase alpha chain [Burkholderiales bacterium 8X]|nr:Tryptophan synthase alpha chain [Burkholderiales bacterium 8X]